MHGYYRYGQPKTLAEAFEATNSKDLLERIRQLPGRPRGIPSRKNERIKVMDAGLRGEALRSLWDHLTKSEQIVVTALVYAAGGRINGEQIAARYGPQTLNEVFRRRGGLSGLENKGTRIYLFLYPEERYRSASTMPEELQERLRALVPPFPKESMASAESLPESVMRKAYSRGEDESIKVPLTRRDMEIAAQHDLIIALRLVGQGKVTVGAKTAQAAATSVRNLGALLHEGDFFDLKIKKENQRNQEAGAIRAHAWPWLLQAAKLVCRRGNKLGLNKSGKVALGAPPHETLKSIWNDWLRNSLFDEFNRVDTIKGQRGKGALGMVEPCGRRVVIAEALRQCPVGEWVRFDEFSRFMQAENQQFKVTEEPWCLYFFEPRYSNLGSDGAYGWNLLQARYMLCFLFEYVASLGMIDVAYTEPHDARQEDDFDWLTGDLEFISRYDGLEYFRVNALGAYCLEGTETYESGTPPARSTLTVLPNRDIQVSGVLSVDEKLLLEAYAIEESENIWRLDGDRTLLAQEAGYDIEMLREFLAARDEQDLPEQVEGFLRKMDYCAHALELKGTALLIECADAEIAERIASSRQAGKLCERAGECGLVVHAAGEEKFKKAVRALGYGML